MQQSSGFLHIIIGPMFSGKTSRLLSLLNTVADMGLKCCYINSILDTRSDIGISTHSSRGVKYNKTNIDILLTDNLVNLDTSNYDYIAVDESQFFCDLEEFVINCVDNLNKKLFIAGLDGNYKREMFGNTLKLIPKCDKLEKLTSYCFQCLKEKGELIDALFSKKIIDNNLEIDISGSEKYTAVCRKHFLDKNEI